MEVSEQMVERIINTLEDVAGLKATVNGIKENQTAQGLQLESISRSVGELKGFRARVYGFVSGISVIGGFIGAKVSALFFK